MKKSYVKPTIEKLGSFESVTKAGNGPNGLDFDFPITTPRSELTFS